MPEVHAKLSASGAKKWLNCPLSISMESEFPNVSSQYAQEGTIAHTLGELMIGRALNLIDKEEYHKRFGEIDSAFTIDEEMYSYIEGYRDFVVERFNEAEKKTSDVVLMLERKLDFSEYVPEGFGTGDVVIITDGSIEIIDLKYGKGVPVSAENNPQLRLYALGAISEYDYMYDISQVTMTIYQPRIDNISSETLTADELLKWGEGVVKPKAKDAFNAVGECSPGKHCDDGFCRARVICKAYADKKLELAAYEFMESKKMSNEDIADVLAQVDDLVSWAKMIKDYALEQAVNEGTEYPGFKLVEGRSNRTYSSEDEIVNVLKDKEFTDKQIYSIKLKGITDMEKLLGKKKFSELLGEYIIKPAGKPTLVPESDKRPKLNTSAKAAEDFKEIINS